MCYSTFLISTSPFSTLVGSSFAVLLCVLWWGCSRPAVIAGHTVRSGVFHHWIHHLWPQGGVPQALTLFGGLGFIARRALKRRMPTGSEAFLELPVALGFGPTTRPTLKTALCHIRTLVGRSINIGTSFAELIRGKESYVISGYIRLTTTSSGRFNNLFIFTVLFKSYEWFPSAGRSISGGH